LLAIQTPTLIGCDLLKIHTEKQAASATNPSERLRRDQRSPRLWHSF